MPTPCISTTDPHTNGPRAHVHTGWPAGRRAQLCSRRRRDTASETHRFARLAHAYTLQSQEGGLVDQSASQFRESGLERHETMLRSSPRKWHSWTVS